MKVLLTGAGGQLGQALIYAKPEGINLIATMRKELDLSDPEACQDAVYVHQPDWVLNAGAYTAVDQAELEPNLAYAVNAEAPRAFAKALKKQGGRLLQLSTDFVFNGQQSFPYRVDQAVSPLSTYGASKAAGETAVHNVFGNNSQALIIRTSWVVGPVGKNFMLTMLRLHREQQQLNVVADQVGCLSSTFNLAEACWRAIVQGSRTSMPPIMHWSDAGVASWYDIAMAVGQISHNIGLIKIPAQVNPITTSDYPTLASRPSYSLLDCTSTRLILKLKAQHWQAALKQLLQYVRNN
ncbi:dTDP-4-dehydrorhamnose reductase [Synechococcus sp. M16CYN]|uniref:dTDP-4-dehydrorhamnose reductase n=1 Tax=Synechococcus sp. M16CYN TaxID=3103139 RepID=UPI0030DE38F4